MAAISSGIAGVAGIDFSVLLARCGSVYTAAEKIAEAVTSSRRFAEVAAHRQFIYVKNAQDLGPVAEDLARCLQLESRELGLATLGSGFESCTEAETAWVLAASSRLDRWTKPEAGTVESVSTIWARPHSKWQGLATLGTPPWKDLITKKPIDRIVFPSRLIEKRLTNGPNQVAISVDFVAYNRVVKSPSRLMGYGVSDQMEMHARDAGFESFLDGQMVAPLFRHRTKLQRPVDDFEERAAEIVREKDGILIPASSDGSIGNDGILALVAQGCSDYVQSAFTALGISLGLEVASYATPADVATADWLRQSERCLAAIKAARFLGFQHEACFARCGICELVSTCGENPHYLTKQASIFVNCRHYPCKIP